MLEDQEKAAGAGTQRGKEDGVGSEVRAVGRAVSFRAL